MNKNYIKGKKKEYKVIFDAVEEMGHGKFKSFKDINNTGRLIAIRSAGSHSPIDCILIDRLTRVIKFIQSKPNNFPPSKKIKIEGECSWLNNVFRCEFELI